MLFTAGMQCARIHTCISQIYTDTYVQRAVHIFDLDKGKSMRFLSQVHSRRASPTVLNLMELEYAKMREDDLSELEAISQNFRQFCRSIWKSTH